MWHIYKSQGRFWPELRPDSGLDFQFKVWKTFQVVPSSLDEYYDETDKSDIRSYRIYQAPTDKSGSYKTDNTILRIMQSYPQVARLADADKPNCQLNSRVCQLNSRLWTT